jgi:hypothetical protein
MKDHAIGQSNNRLACEPAISVTNHFSARRFAE